MSAPLSAASGPVRTASMAARMYRRPLDGPKKRKRASRMSSSFQMTADGAVGASMIRVKADFPTFLIP